MIWAWAGLLVFDLAVVVMLQKQGKHRDSLPPMASALVSAFMIGRHL